MEKSKCKFACQRKQELPIPERRSFKIEVREVEGEKKFVGTPIVYNKKSEDLGFFEIIKPGAATEALKRSDPRLLYGHNSNSLLPIARASAGTLRATETKKGVDIEADPPQKNQFVDALIESIERGDVREMSFGFTVEKDEWKDLDKDRPTRTITKFREIFDYSYVAFAAYGETVAGTDVRVALRSLEAAKTDPTDKPNLAFTPVDDADDEVKVEFKVKRIQVEFEVNGKPIESPYIIEAADINETDIEIKTKTKTETEPPDSIDTDTTENRTDEDTEITDTKIKPNTEGDETVTTTESRDSVEVDGADTDTTKGNEAETDTEKRESGEIETDHATETPDTNKSEIEWEQERSLIDTIIFEAGETI
ncbi:MAG TPA: HK97 family phage prohead protease [Pricia sp.]|nr:HK97 family phage prohead protease [Pricia sp.]